MNRKYLLIGACAVTAAAAYFLLRPAPANDVTSSAPPEGGAMVAIQMPLSDVSAYGSI